MAPRHPLCPDRERQGDGREETFGHEGDDDPDREEESVGEGDPGQQRETEERGAHTQGDHRDGADDAVELDRERRRRPSGRGCQRRDPGKSGRRPRRRDFADRFPFDEERSRERLIPYADGRGLAFPRQGRRPQHRRRRALDPQVGGDAVTRLQEDEIADHQLGGVDLEVSSAADDGRSPREQVAESFRRALRSMLLHERERAVREHDDEDRHAQLRQPRHEREEPGDPEHQREEVRQLSDGFEPQWPRAPHREDVGAVPKQTGRRGGLAQPLGLTTFELLHGRGTLAWREPGTPSILPEGSAIEPTASKEPVKV